MKIKSNEEIEKMFPNIELNEERKNILDLLRNSECHINIQGEAGSGKAQPVDTLIPTPNGIRKLGELKVGDYVFDRLGKPTEILDVFPQGQKEVFEVVLTDGRKTLCNDEHLWSYYTSKGNLKTVTAREMLTKGLIKGKKNNTRFKIPTNGEVEYLDSRKPKLPPYVMGSFLGNGCCRQSQLTISSNDEEQVKYVADLLGLIYKRNSEKNYNWVFYGKDGSFIHTSDIFRDYPNMIGVYSHEKYIDDDFKFSSVEDRYELLKGLFDTDGSIGKNNRHNVSYSSVSLKLIEDIKYILGSLGYSSTIKEDKREGKRTCYELLVIMPNENKEKLFRLTRKLEIAKESKNIKKNRDYSKVGIREINDLGYTTEMVCIMVDNDEHLYLTNDFIVTHNTATLKVLKAVLSENYNVLVTSSTGVASALLNEDPTIKSTTVHSAFGIKPQTIYGTYQGHTKKEILDVLTNIDVLFIEETSMISSSLFDYVIDELLYARGMVGKDLPRIILFGDILQLPPVINEKEKGVKEYFNDFYNGKHYFFNSHAYQDRNFVTVQLHHIYRQDGDSQFKEILNRIRVGNPTDEDLRILNTRVVNEDDWFTDHESCLRICTTNKDVQIYNDVAVKVLEDFESYVFKANIGGNFRNSDAYRNGLCPEEIELKEGLQVMITRNAPLDQDTNDRPYVNGTMGIVESCDIEGGTVVVRLPNDTLVTVPKARTEIYDYIVNNDNGKPIVEPKCTGWYENVPVKPCVCLTVFKSQGMTLDSLYFDKGSSYGWIPKDGLYVALSRCKSLEGVGLKYPIKRTDVTCEKEALDFLKEL